MKKISIITPSLNGGGAEKVAVNLANYYVSIGYEVDLVVLRMLGPYIDLVSSKVNLIDLNVKRTRYAFFKLRDYFKQNSGRMVLSVIRDSNIFVGLSSMGLSLGSIVFREANTLNDLHKMSLLKRVVYKHMMKLAYKKANAVIANSHDTKKDLEKAKMASLDKMTVISNPVLPIGYDQMAMQPANHPWFHDKHIKVILSVGRLAYQKNFEFMIESFYELYKKVDSVRLMIVGEGAEKDALLSLIKKYRLEHSIEIIPFQKNIFPYYQQADVFALSSRWEGFGNVIVEALSVGLPIVTTNCPGGPKMILQDGKYGGLVENGDKNGYVEALEDALTKGKSEERMCYAKNFSVENIAVQYLSVLKGQSPKELL